MIRTQIQLTENQSDRIKNIATQEQVSMAEIIRRAVDHWLETAAPMSREERWQRSMAVIGKYSSGLTDLSENHDEYLAEGYGTW